MSDTERLARAFHEAYERLAPLFGYETRKESAVPWEQVPDNNRALMIAVCTEIMPGSLREARHGGIVDAAWQIAQDCAASCERARSVRGKALWKMAELNAGGYMWADRDKVGPAAAAGVKP